MFPLLTANVASSNYFLGLTDDCLHFTVVLKQCHKELLLLPSTGNGTSYFGCFWLFNNYFVSFCPFIFLQISLHFWFWWWVVQCEIWCLLSLPSLTRTFEWSKAIACVFKTNNVHFLLLSKRHLAFKGNNMLFYRTNMSKYRQRVVPEVKDKLHQIYVLKLFCRVK